VKAEIPPTAGLPLGWKDLWSSASPQLPERAAAFLGMPEVQIECSGTACLIVALTALRGLSHRRTVIIPAYTCPLVPLAIAHCGLRIQLCDLAPDHFDLDYEMLATLCDHDTLAVVPTHLAGRIANVEAAVICASSVGAWVIEDAAQAFGARAGGRCVGDFADIGFFSLAVGKGLTTYEGGVLCSNRAPLRAAMRDVSARIIGSNRMREWGRALQLLGYAALYRPRYLPMAYGAPLRRALRRGDLVAAVGDTENRKVPLHRMGSWRRRVGARALDRLADFQIWLAALARARVAQLRRIDGLKVFSDPPGLHGVWPCLLVLMPSEAARDAALAQLWPAGLGVSRLFIHALPDYGFLASIVPRAPVQRARNFASRTLTLSNSPWLTDAQFERIVAVLADVIASKPRSRGVSFDSSRSLISKC
jgi:dTDP-4-amino-4,6-dideoxygalactose transaminase